MYSLVYRKVFFTCWSAWQAVEASQEGSRLQHLGCVRMQQWEKPRKDLLYPLKWRHFISYPTYSYYRTVSSFKVQLLAAADILKASLPFSHPRWARWGQSGESNPRPASAARSLGLFASSPPVIEICDQECCWSIARRGAELSKLWMLQLSVIQTQALLRIPRKRSRGTKLPPDSHLSS